MKTKIKSLNGENTKDIKFPAQFSEEIRPDLIKRAVLVIQNNRDQEIKIGKLGKKEEELEKKIVGLEKQIERLAIAMIGMSKALENQSKFTNRIFNPVQNTK